MLTKSLSFQTYLQEKKSVGDKILLDGLSILKLLESFLYIISANENIWFHIYLIIWMSEHLRIKGTYQTPLYTSALKGTCYCLQMFSITPCKVTICYSFKEDHRRKMVGRTYISFDSKSSQLWLYYRSKQ